MSLVNDALKRAREAQQETPPPPIREAPYQDHEHCAVQATPWYMSRTTLTVVVIIALILVWQSLRQSNGVRSDAIPAVVAARETPEPVSPPEAAPTEPVAATEPADTAMTPVSEQEVEPTVAVPAPAVAAVTPPAAPSFRLQAVIWNPKRPSAIINGKTVFIGDRIQQQKVVAISQDSATLSGTGEKLVLSIRQE